MAQAPKAPQAPQMQFEYVDRPDVEEVFADFVNRVQFDGQTLRFEFCVTRLDDQRPQGGVSGRRYPSCRLVLSSAAAVDLMNKMQQITATLIKSGVLKADPPKAPQNVA